MSKQDYLKQSLKPLVLMSCMILTSQQGFADTSKDMLNVLSEEASNTKMANKQNENKIVVDPTTTMKLDNKVATEDLSAKIEKQLRQVLGAKDDSEEDSVSDRKNTETELEKIVSSSLLDGAKMDDIRSAVSDAMAEIKSDKKKEGTKAITLERITEADKAFSKLTVTNKVSKTTTISDVSTKPSKTTTVQEGESLFKIALRVYGDGNKYYKLYKANEDQIKDPNLLLAGQVLRTPDF